MDDLIGQLIFLVIAAVIWIVGEAARLRREKAEREQAEQEEEPGVQAPAPAELPRERIPTPPTPQQERKKRRRERARVVLEDILGLPRSEAPPAEEPPPPQPTPVVEAPPPVAAPPPMPLVDVSEPATPSLPRAWRRRQAALKRLGIRPGAETRQATRRAILWAEVLGPPRALRGPHRPPLARR